MKKIEFSEDDQNTIVDMYKNGNSAIQIGNVYGCSRVPITKVLKEKGITLDTHLRKISKQDYSDIGDLYSNGKTF